jgi:hypothetical protein
MSVYIINGAPGAGKSTFCEKVRDIVGKNWSFELSTVDLVKQIATDLGWNGEKTLKNRKFLSDLKGLLAEWDDIPFKDTVKKVKLIKDEFERYDLDFNEAAIFINCREPEEIQRLCMELNAKSILVSRESAEDAAVSNHSDANVLKYEYDIVIYNNGTLKDLVYRALDFIDIEELHINPYKNLEIDNFGNVCYN